MVLFNNRQIKIIEMVFIIPIIRSAIGLRIKIMILIMIGTASKLSTLFSNDLIQFQSPEDRKPYFS